MRKFIKKFFSVLLVSALFLSGCGNTSNTNTPKYVFYFIGDGMGSSHRMLAEGYMQYKTNDMTYRLAMNDMPITANLTTRSLSSQITDSAAAGTALASGEKTGTGIIGLDESGEVEYTSILKALQQKGMSVGLVTNVTITHATPASFGANVKSRNDETTIAKQYLAAEYDYLAGGGARYFLSEENGGKREAGDDLIDDFEEKGYKVDTSLEDYQTTDFSSVTKYLGIYQNKYLTDVITQTNTEKTSPTLAEMVTNGIEVLSKNKNGFFMMVEGGYIDGAAHNNDTATVLHEMLAMDDAVKVALEYYEKYPKETLIIVTADHATGGLSLGYNSYSVNYQPLDSITSSYAEAIDPYLINKDYDGFFNAIEQSWNVSLSNQDKEDIKRRIDEFPIANLAYDLGMDPQKIPHIESSKHMMGLGGYAASFVLSRETKIGWATQAHTAEPVPMTSIGVGSNKLAKCSDISEIAPILAEIFGVKVGIVDN